MTGINALFLLAGLLLFISVLASTISARLGLPLLLLFLAVGMLAGQDGPGGIVFNDYFIATMIGVGITAQLATGGADRDDRSGIAAICRAIASAPDDDGEALRDAFAGPAHDALHDLAARTEATDRSVAGELLRAKQQIEASLTDPDAELDPGPALPAAIRRASATVDIAAPEDCTLEPS